MTQTREQATAEILRVCRGLLDESIPVIEGCRRLSSLRHDIGATESKAFQPFVAVESETDHLPLGEARQHCSPEWLAAADAEMAEASRFHREHIREATSALLHALENAAGQD